MFELPEVTTLASQADETLLGRIVREGALGNRPHKFVWYNRGHEEFARLTSGRRVGAARARGRWLFVPLEPGYVLLLGEFGGKMLFHEPGAPTPAGYHLSLRFEDGSALTVTTSMWGAMELYETGAELEREYVRDMRPTPVEETFTYDYFSALIDEVLAGQKRSVKGLLTQDQLIPGLGNAIAQDILFRAGLHPRHDLAKLDGPDRQKLYDAIVGTVHEVIDHGGRNDEIDLFGRPGGYSRIMDRRAAGRPCPSCGTPVQKIQYLGGACYLCPSCQT
jgi:formamidopyrimidine-DNA glycosylase